MAHVFTTARLEAFSDGVIAVIITIMVLELKVPQFNGAAGLRTIAPTLAVYALSYAFVGIYWINHHMLLEGIENSNPRILRANLVWLFFLSLLPFFTAYVLDKREDRFSVALYSASLLMTGFSFLILRLGVNARRRREGRFEREDHAVQRKHWLSLGMYAAAIPLAFAAPILALCLMGAVTLLWIVPTFGVEHLREQPAALEQPR